MAVGKDRHEKAAMWVHVGRYQPLLIWRTGVGNRDRKLILQCNYGIGKIDAMLCQVALRLCRIPFAFYH